MKQKTLRLLQAAALLFLAAVMILVNLPGPTPLPVGAEVGDVLPDFQTVCVDGSSFWLSAQRGKIVVINLWATWCTPCVRELPNFDRLQQERPGEVAVLALHAPPVTSDVADYLSGFSYEIPFAVDEDGHICELLHASTVLPQTLILSPDGVLTYHQSGALSYADLTELVDAAARD